MDITTFRILDITSAHLSASFSINQLTEKIKETYGTAHYANIYKKLHDLQRQGILNLDHSGKSSIIRLNFRNYLLIDYLAEMEIMKKRKFLKTRNDIQIFLLEMEKAMRDMNSIGSICYAKPERNIKLNRVELLFLLRYPEKESARSAYQSDTARIYTETQKLQNKYNLRIESLVLDESEFHDLIESDEINPLKEALSDKIVIFCPQTLWREMKGTAEKTEIRTGETETKPAHISSVDLAYNLARFGYKEFGLTIEQGQKICIEYVITSLLVLNDARRIEAIPVIIAKNDIRSNLMIFLSQKYETSGRLLGLLKVLQHITPTKKIDETTRLLKILGAEEIQANEKSILQKMRLYNAA